MIEHLTLFHERVDDIPLLIGLMQRLRLPEVLAQHLGTHAHHQGLHTGWLVTVWLAFILSEGDHRKSTVQDWVSRHQQTLEGLLGQPIRPTDFTDDRLGNVLRRLSHSDAWAALEASLWRATIAVYEVEVTGVRLDSPTVAGYHTVREDGLMQLGHSKDHRPDLPQLKLMAAAAEPSGHLLAGDVHAGQHADDPLYTPLIARVRQMLGRSGVLYTGDCKMAALATRADIAAHDDLYLVALPLTGATRTEVDAWIDAVVDGAQAVTLIWDGTRLLGAGYEVARVLEAKVAEQRVRWTEVQVVRSRELAQAQARHLQQRLDKAEAALRALTPAPGRGQRQYRDEAVLQAAVTQLVERYGVTDLLHVTWQREEQSITRYVGRGRGSPTRPTRTEVQVRYVITAVERDEAAISRQQYRLGWRVQVTNQPQALMTLPQAVLHYREGCCLERDFHLVKDRPLGISPLYVRRDDQITGLTRLLTLIETQVRRGLAQDGASLAGLYAGQPTRMTTRPTAVRLLQAVAKSEVTLTRVAVGPQQVWHLTPVPAWVVQVLGYLGLSIALYTRLTENST